MQKSISVRKRHTAEERSEILEAYRRSEQTQKEFATEAGISVSALQLWLRRGGNARGTTGTPTLVRAPNLFSSGPPPARYCLTLPGGMTLDIRCGFDAAELASLLRTLRSV